MQENKEKPKYTPTEFENKWSDLWLKDKIYKKPEIKKGDKKFYSLYSYPYPSGAGLHVGHVEGMVANDISARFYRMNSYASFLPMGWDSFGLPAENYAIKTNRHPKDTTDEAIKTFISQINKIGIGVDWDSEVAAHDPNYYKWTQWIFLQLYKKGLAYKKEAPVNWCPSCQTVLANEQVVEGKCERCESVVEQKLMSQWFYKITDYAERLIKDLKDLDWPESTKNQQLNWIGKSSGIEIDFEVVDTSEKITVFTTTPVNFGATFLVLAPEHQIIDSITTPEYKAAVKDYIAKSKKETELQRQTNKEKTGVFTGSYVINHVTGDKIPVWISDFVLINFGTGAVQGCPGHDQRDWDFAKKFGIPIVKVVNPKSNEDFNIEESCFQIHAGEEGIMVNSEFLNGLDFTEAMQKTMDYFEEKGWGKRITNYKLRDWLLSRQRYWGAPIPIVYDKEGKPVPVKEEHLPWMLPTDVDFIPKGYSPLSRSNELKERVTKLYGEGFTPEFDTMDTFVDSSWYYFRHLDAKNEKEFAHSEILNAWLPTDLYMIGAEHIVLHLFYSRFFTKFLFDEGYIDFEEPFYKMRHMGTILGPDGRKMSKRWGNVVNPTDVCNTYGADSLRLYEMFMGPIDVEKPWNPNAISGVYRFLNKVFDLMHSDFTNESNPKLQSLLHKTIKKVGEDVPALKFNTAIATMMEFTNEWNSLKLSAESRKPKTEIITRNDAYSFLKLLAPFAPFIAEELNKNIFQSDKSIHLSKWPEFDSELLLEDFVVIPVQVNGKLRAELKAESQKLKAREEIIQMARELVQSQLEGQEVKKEIYIEGRIVNFVI